jgi:hypothetical protein
MPPATTRARPPHRPLTGSLWLAARLSLAIRRTRRFTRWWLGVGGAVTVVALLIPVATGDPQAELRVALERAAADTLRSAATLARAEARAAVADSLLETARREAIALRPRPTAARAPSSLARAIAAARAERTAVNVLALSEEPAVVGGPRMRATADSFRVAATPGEAFRLAGIIIAMAEFRLRAEGENSLPVVAPPVQRSDTMAIVAIATAERDTVAVARRAHEAAQARAEAASQRAAAARTQVPLVSPGLALMALVLVGYVARIGLATMRELGDPRLAHPLEAEREVGAAALSWVRDPLPEGPLRFRPTGVDPFRVLYLQLTSTGTRTRTVIVTGEDAVIVAAMGARLAIAAAADHRTTLVGEWDSEQIALARVFRDHPEPGVSDAMAGAFTWREVARNVGSSDGLSIAMLPAGTSREPVDAERQARAVAEFQAFRDTFELSILAVALKDLAHARALMPDAPIVLCATLGVTRVAELRRAAAKVTEHAVAVHSLALWDAPRPTLPSRAELAAWLSKRKGRTPGGSFKAVQEAIKRPV